MIYVHFWSFRGFGPIYYVGGKGYCVEWLVFFFCYAFSVPGYIL